MPFLTIPSAQSLWSVDINQWASPGVRFATLYQINWLGSCAPECQGIENISMTNGLILCSQRVVMFL
jgi:hypothetical protein